MLDIILIDYGYSWIWMFAIKSLPHNFIKSLLFRGVDFKPSHYQYTTPKWLNYVTSKFETDPSFTRQIPYVFKSELSYCPICWSKKQYRYYKTEWRNPFQLICLQHGVELIDTCQFCNEILWPNKQIQYFTHNWLTNCPHCKRKLINQDELDVKLDLIELQEVILENISQFIEHEKNYKSFWQNSQINLRLLGEGSLEKRLQTIYKVAVRIKEGLTEYYCIHSGKQFSNLESFRDFAKITTYNLFCEICGGENFKTRGELDDHIAICGKGLYCKKCKKSDFTLFSIYQNHIELCGKYQCMICDELFSSKRKWKQHSKDCSSTLVCENCGRKGFQSYDEVSEHRMVCRDQCPKCGKSKFDARIEFENHKWTCGKSHRCKYCNKGDFPSRDSYFTHIKECKLKGYYQTSLNMFFE